MTKINKEFYYSLKLITGFAINSFTMFSFGYMVGGDEVRDHFRFSKKIKNINNTNTIGN